MDLEEASHSTCTSSVCVFMCMCRIVKANKFEGVGKLLLASENVCSGDSLYAVSVEMQQEGHTSAVCVRVCGRVRVKDT